MSIAYIPPRCATHLSPPAARPSGSHRVSRRAQVLFREDCTIDQFIDLIEGNRKYVRCLYVYNKIDMTSIEECRRVSATPDAMVLSCRMGLNLDIFKDMLWEYLGLVRVYTKPRGKKPDVRPTRMPHGTPSIWLASPIPPKTRRGDSRTLAV